jgi:protein-L-isoaspartate(D-aspartate) O-methyltransferase
VSALELQRRFFAEEIQVTFNLKSAGLIEALACVPRERFLPPGPWTIAGEGDFQAPPRQTADADPRHVYHNVSVAIDSSRMLFNGAPGVIAQAIDKLAVKPGEAVLHLGTGLGYYTALIASCVGRTGRVLGIEADADLAAAARANLADSPWVEIRTGNGTDPIDGPLDAMLVNAGVTHPLPTWLDALAPGGRMILPLTATMASMGTIGKGLMVLLTKEEFPGRLSARLAGFVAIYSALGIRDEATNACLGKAMAGNPFAPLKALRRDPHEAGPTCWLHTPGGCLSLA